MRIGSSRYWLFQVTGWGLFALINVFFALTFDKVSNTFLNRLIVFLCLGILITHFMRWIIHKMELLLKPLNLQIPGFILLTFIIALIIGTVEIGVYKLLNLQSEKNTYTLFGLILVNTFNSFIYLFIWNLYLFYLPFCSKKPQTTIRYPATGIVD